MGATLRAEGRALCRNGRLWAIYIVVFGAVFFHCKRLLAPMEEYMAPYWALNVLFELTRFSFWAFGGLLLIAFLFGGNLRHGWGEWGALQTVVLAKGAVLLPLLLGPPLVVAFFCQRVWLAAGVESAALFWQLAAALLRGWVLPGLAALLAGLWLALWQSRTRAGMAAALLLFLTCPLGSQVLRESLAGLPLALQNLHSLLLPTAPAGSPGALGGLPAEGWQWVSWGLWTALLLAALCWKLWPGLRRWLPRAAAPLSLAALCLWRVGALCPAVPAYYCEEGGEGLQNHSYSAAKAAEGERFSLLSCDLNLQLGQQLRAVATLTVDRPMEKCDFTLLSGYRVTAVTGEDGAELPYRQGGDYLQVDAGGRQTFSIAYRGNSFFCSVDGHSAALPGCVAYYPRPGVRRTEGLRLNSWQAGGGMQPIVDAQPYDCTLRVRGGRVFTNLEQQTDGSYRGRTNGVTVLSGLLREEESGQRRGVLLEISTSKKGNRAPGVSAEINAFLQKTGALAPAVEKIPRAEELPTFELPQNLLSGDSGLVVLSDHILYTRPWRPEGVGPAYLVSRLGGDPEKELVAWVLQELLTKGGEGGDFSSSLFQGEEAQAIYNGEEQFALRDLMAATARLERRQVYSAYIAYLADDSDTRTPREFAAGLAEMGEERALDEDVYPQRPQA